jgi:ParB-like chromosome segregation protein Spo0J/2'-5' RNA ligase
LPQSSASPDIFDDVAGTPSASSTDIFDQVSGGEPEKPKTYLPEVNKAVASVPKPDSPLNYAVPGNDVTGAVTGFFPEKAPRNGPRAQLPATPPLEAVKATLEATPPQSETPLLPGASTAVTAGQDLATPGQRWKGATEAVQAAGEAVTPFMGPAATEMAAAPALAPALKFATGLGVGIGGQPLAEKGAEKLGASPEQQKFWGELAFWAPQMAGLLASQVKGGVDITPEGTRAAISTPGGKVGAGVAVTPESVTVRGKVGPLEGSKTFQRGGGQQPGQIEAPTIEGQPPAAQPGPPPPSDDPAITSMANAHQAQTTAAKQAAGIPEPPPPTILDQPNAPPELKENRIAPESITRMASFVAGLPDAQRAQAVQEAHQTLTAALTEMGKKGPVSLPDGTLALVKDPKSAEKLAISIINDAVKAHDKVSASLSGEGERGKQTGAVSPKEAASGDIFDQAAQNPTETGKPSPAAQEAQQPLKKGDTATLARDIDVNGKTLAKGTPVTLTYVHPNGLLARATTEDGTKISRGVGAFTKGVTNESSKQEENAASIQGAGKSSSTDTGRVPSGPVEGGSKPSGVSEVGTPPELAKEVKEPKVAAEPEHPNLNLGEHAAHTEMVPTKTVAEYGKDVEMLPVEELEKLATHDRRKEPFGSDMDELKADIQKNGIKEPLELGYNHAEKKAVIWDGNHRLGVAKELGLKELPVRVKATDFPTAKYGKEVAGYKGEGQVPERLKPSDIGIGARPVQTEAKQEEKPTKYKFGNTQAPIPAGSEAATSLKAAQDRIAASDLAGKGKETDPHVTVRYGIKTEDTKGIREFLSKQAPFEAKLGKTDKFPPSEHSEGAAVIIAPIEAPELHRLNAELEKHGDFTEPSFKEFRPHATIAYVDPDRADRYVGMDVTRGKTFTIDRIYITDRNGNAEAVKLEGKDVKEAPKPRADRGEVARGEVARGGEEGRSLPADEQNAVAGTGARHDDRGRREQASLDSSPSGVSGESRADSGGAGHPSQVPSGEVSKSGASRTETATGSRLPSQPTSNPLREGASVQPQGASRVERVQDLQRGENAGVPSRQTTQVTPEPTANERQRQQLGLPPQPGKVGEMNVRDLKVAPNKFQYKLSTDAEGVGTLLKETKVFNPDLAGVISVWYDPADRKTYVVNGHHRYELAKRTGQKTVTVRHIVAKDAVTARAIGALQNIAEGRGTAIDAAKFFRDSGLTPEQLKEKGISLGEKTASDGLAMSKLDPAIFQKVVSGDLRQGTAIAIGEGTADHAQQAAILKQIDRMERKGQKVSDSRIREFIRLADQSEKRTEETTSLFGTEQVERSLLWEKSAVSEYVQDQLKKDKRLFGFVAKEGRATELARAGNKIDVEKSKEISTGAAQAEEVYNKLSARGGPIASILDEAARKLADGESAGEVKSDAYQRIRAEVSKTLQGSERAGAERSEGTPEGKEDTGISLFSPETQLAPPFYSKAARVAFEKLPSFMPGDSALATLKNAGVKADEIKWIGLDDLLAGKPKVSKRDVLSHIMRNMVQIREVQRGGRAEMVFREGFETRGDLMSHVMGDEMLWSRRMGGLKPGLEVVQDAGGKWNLSDNKELSTKYQSYTLPGEKKNYTELLLTVPELPTQKKFDPSKVELRRNRRSVTQGSTAIYYDGKLLASYGDDPQLQPGGEYKQRPDSHWMQVAKDVFTAGDSRNSIQSLAGGFRSGHFDEPNILAHVRFDDRTDADGKRVLFVEEVQSDWHQKGKKQGYIQPVDSSKWTAEKVMHGKEAEPYNEWIAKQPWFISGALSDKASPRAHELYDEYKGRVESWRTKSFVVRDESGKQLGERYADSAQEAIQQQAGMEEGARNRNKVPDAPFKSDWHELAMKRMLRAAAENGYDKLAWVTGEQTADRYDLSKHIDRLTYTPSEGRLVATKGEAGRGVFDRKVRPEELSDYVGKDAAEKLLKSPLSKDKEGIEYREISGLDLKVGGEWAKNLYDRAIPNFLSKYGKKWGVKIGTAEFASHRYGIVQDGMDNYRIVNEQSEAVGRPFRLRESAEARLADLNQSDKVHSLSITPEMRASVLSEGQPLFSAATGPILPSVAKAIEFSVQPTKEGLPSYLELNGHATEAINRALGVRVHGVNLDAKRVPEIATKLKNAADKMQRVSPEGAGKLRALANALLENTDKESGLNVIRSSEDKTHQLATLHEEMLHSMQRKAGAGKLSEGVPWREVIGEEGMAKMAVDRIIPDLMRAGAEPSAVVVAAEGMVDLLRGDALADLTPEQAEKSAEKYFEAMLATTGIEPLKTIQAVQDYIAAEQERLGVEYAADANAIRKAGQIALSRVISSATGKAVGRAGEAVSAESKPQREGLPGASGSGTEGPDTSNDPGKGGQGNTAALEGSSETLASTQPIGLTDEELEQWAKSKGFRYEPAGEQLGMFGGNDQLLRVFRQGPRGREQRGLVYQNQLDRLQESQSTAPTEPFSLTGGEEREEQPRLFGAGDLGEIIGTPQTEKPKLPTGTSKDKNDFSLFSSDRGEADLSKLGKDVRESAEAVQGYLKSVREYTRIARDLQRGLETLDSQKQADILRAKQTMEDIKLPHADDEKLYHHLEDPEHVDLTPKQDEVLDNVILPIADQNNDLFTELTNGGVPVENYVHRVVKGKGGVLDRIAQGVKGVGQKASLSKSAPQTKHRTYMALEKSAERGQGNVFTRPGDRVVVSIKGGQVTAWRNGQPENLGGISNTEEGKAFKDKDGNLWTLQQATTKEIEQHTETRYYHSALASTLVSNIQLGSAVRAMRFLNEFKKSEDFRESAFDLKTKGNPPKGWQTTKLQQFAGYAFEPRTAEVLDWYADRSRQGNMGALDQIGKFMRIAMLLNPIMHPMNVAASWAMERGATGFLMPTNYRNAWKAGNKAVKAVLSQNQDFLDALDAGAPLQSHREAIKDITKLFFDQLAEGLGKQEPWAVKVAKSLGIEHGNLLNILHKFSSSVAWASNDIFFLQSAYEHQAAGMSLQDALKETGRVIPEYRVPTRILDSQLLSKLMTNRWATIFGAYHYSLLKSFGEVAKSALGAGGGGQPPTGKGRQFGTGAEGSGFNGRTRAQEIAKGWDRLALLALVTMALYPILDDLLKKATGDKHAAAKRFGPFALIDAIAAAAHRQQSVSTTAQRIVTPAPQTKAAAELLMDREFYSGRHIYDPHADWKTQAQEVGRYIIGEMGQIGQVEKAQTTEQKRKLAWQQVGVSFRKTRAGKIAADIAAEKSGKQAEDPEDEKNRVLRREILEQLRKGNQKPLEDAKSAGEITHKQIKSLEHRAHLTPLQDTVHGFTYSEARRVYEAADADEKKELDPIMRQKRVNMLKAGRGKELTTSNP